MGVGNLGRGRKERGEGSLGKEGREGREGGGERGEGERGAGEAKYCSLETESFGARIKTLIPGDNPVTEELSLGI